MSERRENNIEFFSSEMYQIFILFYYAVNSNSVTLNIYDTLRKKLVKTK